MRDGYVFVAVLGGVISGLTICTGNYLLQRRIVQLQRTDELRRRFYDYLQLVTDYWLAESPTRDQRGKLETRMVVAWRVVLADYRHLANQNRKARRSFNSTMGDRISLQKMATGGDFQGESWSPAPDRVEVVATYITKILDTFP